MLNFNEITNHSLLTTIAVTLISTIVLGNTPLAHASSFTDIEGPYQGTIEYLEDKGVIQGYGDAQFRPDQKITKAEFFTLLYKNDGFTPDSDGGENSFSNVPDNHWALPYLEQAHREGLIQNPNTFEPLKPLTRLQASRTLLNHLNISTAESVEEDDWTLDAYHDLNENSWYAPLLLAATESQLIDALEEEEGYFRPFRSLTRGEATELLYNVDVYEGVVSEGTVSTTIDDTSSQDALEINVFGEDVTYDIPHLDILLDIWIRIHEEYYGEDIDDEALIYSAIEALVNELGDPYTSFFEPVETEEYSSYLEGEVSGIGAVLIETDDGVSIESLLVDSPAENSGLQPGDLILEIDGVDVTDESIESIANRIRGEVGTEITLTVERTSGNQSRTLEFTLTRAIVDVGYLSGEILEDGILYIDINLFESLTFIDFTQTVQGLMEETDEVQGFILDVRDNPGGYLSTVRSIVGHFIPYGDTILYTEGVDGKKKYTSTGQGEWAEYPVIVLVNGSSASASEILAIALQEEHDATVVGTQTYGKGTVQQIVYYDDGSSVKMTIAEWKSPSGRSINDVGVTPDYEIERTAEDQQNGEDPPLDKALELLQ